MAQPGRNEICNCGSGIKYKKCCGKSLEKHIPEYPLFALRHPAPQGQNNDAIFQAIHEQTEDTDEFQAAALMSGLLDVPLTCLEGSYPEIAKGIKAHHPVKSAIAFAGLLTMPELQSNCLRIEALVYFSLAYGDGDEIPSFDTLQRWFSGLENSLYGNYEDPAEDVFVSLVSTPRGNYRIFDGLYEAGSFHLQRTLSIIETMPKNEDFDTIRRGVETLLKISEHVAGRLGIERHKIGNLFPEEKLSPSIKKKINKAKEAIQFTEQDLRNIGVEPANLKPFIFDLAHRSTLSNENLRHSSLEKHPFILHEGVYYLLLPTAISATIRQFVIGLLYFGGLGKNFERALVSEYRNLFSTALIFGRIKNIPLNFSPVASGYVATAATEVDNGRFLQFIFFVDNIKGFEKDGLNGVNSVANQSSFDFENIITPLYEDIAGQPSFRSGITLIVGCGWGRSLCYKTLEKNYKNWEVQHISASDLMTLSWKHEFKPLTLFRVFDALNQLSKNNVQIMNMNGLLNLYAHIEGNDGHIISHDNTPEGFGGLDRPNMLIIEQSKLVHLRHEVATHWDVHYAPDEEGKLFSVRKEAQSIFKEDLELPLYISETEIGDGRLRAVYETEKRFWWIEAILNPDTPRSNYQIEFFKMLYIWLARAVPVLENNVSALPTGVISWKVSFIQGDGVPAPTTLTENELRELTQVSCDKETKIITLNLEPKFDKGFANPKNIAEKIIVEKLITGVLLLCGIEPDAPILQSLTSLTVPDDDARHMHGFYSHTFRDFIRDNLPSAPITIDQMDHALLHIGMGWQVGEKGAKAQQS